MMFTRNSTDSMPANFHRLVLAACALMLAASGCRASLRSDRPNSSVSPGCAREQIDHGRKIEKSISAAGLERKYILDVPDAVKAGQPAALIFDFHGWGHSGSGVWNVSRFKELAERDGFVTVYPDGLPISLMGRDPRPGWEIQKTDGNRDLEFVRAMLAEIEASYCIDLDRVYSTGFSNGGYLSHLLACEMSERFAAVAPVGGGDLLTPCHPSRPVPVLIHHGTQDPLIPLAKAQAARDGWATRNGCGSHESKDGCQHFTGCRDGADVAYCEENVAHSWPVPATARIWSFFQNHPRR